MYLVYVYECNVILTSNARRAPCSSSLASRHRKKYCVKGDKRSFWTFLKSTKEKPTKFWLSQTSCIYLPGADLLFGKSWNRCDSPTVRPKTKTYFCHFVDETLTPFRSNFWVDFFWTNKKLKQEVEGLIKNPTILDTARAGERLRIVNTSFRP